MSCSYLKSAHVPKRTEDMSSFSIGQMNQLANALEKAGFDKWDVTNLGQYPNLADIKKVLQRKSEITVRIHVIDCDATPTHYFLKNSSWRVRDHRKTGRFVFEPSKMVVEDASEEEYPKGISSPELFTRLEGKRLGDGNLLEYLIDNPFLVPQEWCKEGMYYCFPGTTWYDEATPSSCDGIMCMTWNRFNRWDYAPIYISATQKHDRNHKMVLLNEK